MIFIPENICLDNFKTQKLFPKFPAVDFQGYEPNSLADKVTYCAFYD